MRVFAYFLRVQKVGRLGGETPNPKAVQNPHLYPYPHTVVI